MTTDEFTDRMIGVPWVNRACSFTACDCWGLVTLYYRHVIDTEIHHDSGYESDGDFMTCYQNEVDFWKQEDHPVSGGIFVAYDGSIPVHVGVVLGGMVLHSRGDNGHVRLDRLLTIQRIYSKVEFMTYAGN